MKILLLYALISQLISNNDKPAYRIIDSNGNTITYDAALNLMVTKDVIFFGEYHNNPIIHWLQYEFTKDLFARTNGKMVLGAEMFESDDQIILNEYLSGLIKEGSMLDEAKMWPNYETDYRPLIEFAKDNKIPFIATNIPRRYASLVSKEGFEGLEKLSADAKKFIAPLPVEYDPELPCYKNMMDMGAMGSSHANVNLPKAQAIKDATMAFFISKNLKEGFIFMHYNGAYHSDFREGTPWYLKKYAPDASTFIISVEEVDDLSKIDPETYKKGDIIILVPSTMTKTH